MIDKSQYVQEAFRMLLHGSNNSEIVNFFIGYYGLTDFQAKDIIREAKEKVKVENAEEVDYIRNQSILRYNLLFKKALKEKRFRDCAEIQQKICKIYGLESININGKLTVDHKLTSMSTDELNQKIKELESIMGKTDGN